MNKQTFKAIAGSEPVSDMRKHFNELEKKRQAKKRFNTTYEAIKEQFEKEQNNG